MDSSRYRYLFIQWSWCGCRDDRIGTMRVGVGRGVAVSSMSLAISSDSTIKSGVTD